MSSAGGRDPVPAQDDGFSVAPERCYLVCATPRSGSTLLCNSLEAAGVAGRPREYFWELRSPEVLRLLPADSEMDRDAERAPTWSRDDYERHVAAALREGTTPNGVFGAKLMWSYFNDFLALMRGIPRFAGLGDGSLLNAALPELRYVFVSRSDKVRQAVSLWRALQTLVWQDTDVGAEQREQRPVYSFDAIGHLLDQLRRHEDAWRGFFFRIGQRPLSLYYEDIAGDLEGTVGRVLDDLRIARPQDGLLARQPLSRQSDELSESWVQSYLEDVSRR